MSQINSIIVGGYSASGDWVYNPETDDYDFIPDGGGIGYMNCYSCCECPSVFLEGRSRGASTTKCGYGGWAPPAVPSPVSKIYSVITQAGQHQYIGFHADPSTTSYSGAVTRDRVTCLQTCGFTYAGTYAGNQAQDPDSVSCSATLVYCGYAIGSTTAFYGPGSPLPHSCGQVSFGGGILGTANTISETVMSWSSTSSNGSFNFSLTLSELYTTEALIATTVAKLGSYGAWITFNSGAPIAARSLTTNELSYATGDAVYRFRFKPPKVGSGSTYIITWVERFTPSTGVSGGQVEETVGGAPIDTVMSYSWDGVIPGDYNETLYSTWPLSPEYTLAAPATNGTTTVACFVGQCSGTAPADPCNP